MKTHSRSETLWLDFFDTAVPAYVKQRYSPDARWKDKPFAKADARFFVRGIQELSDRFTEGRAQARAMQSYFEHERFRSSYLLYFLPLQAKKFLTLFEQYAAALAPLERAKEIRIADFGAGPATASLAFLLWLSQRPQIPERIVLEWVDTQAAILKDATELVRVFTELVPRFRDRITVRTHVRNWWECTDLIETGAPLDLALFGNVLNEGMAQGPRVTDFWKRLLARGQSAGTLWVEPADRGSSQLISRLRDAALAEGWVFPPQAASDGTAGASAIWGPCLHAGKCPLAEGRDWCHTSVRAEIQGTWFRDFSIGLGSLREWVKYSYLWFAGHGHPAQHPGPTPPYYRVVSDPLDDGRSLLCVPEAPLKAKVADRSQRDPRKSGPRRGDLWKEGIRIASEVREGSVGENRASRSFAKPRREAPTDRLQERREPKPRPRKKKR